MALDPATPEDRICREVSLRGFCFSHCISSIPSEPPGKPSFIPKSQHTQPLVSCFLDRYPPSPPPPAPAGVPFSSLLQLAFPWDYLLHQPLLRNPSFPGAAHAACLEISTPRPLLQTVARRGRVVTGCPPALPAQGHMLCSQAPIHTSMYKPWGFGQATGTVILLTLEGGSEDELRRGTHSSQHSDWPRVSPQ